MGPKKKPHQRPTFNSQLPPRGPRWDTTPVEAVRNERPVWRVASMDMDGPWGWKEVSPEDAIAIHERLRCFESMTWGEIESTPSCGLMDAAATCREARDRLVAIQRDDVAALFKLRVTQKGRVWGARLGLVFEVLWWDPQHTVYPMDIADNGN